MTMEDLVHNNNWEISPVDPQVVSKYYVTCIILLEAATSTSAATDPEDSEEVLVLLQINCEGIKESWELKTEEFRDEISAKIPYYHTFDDLSECLTFEQIYSLHTDVLVLDEATGMYKKVTFESHFNVIFKIEP